MTTLPSMPICAEINHTMQELTDKICTGRQQHVDISISCSPKDTKDVKLLIEFLDCVNPFNENLSLKALQQGLKQAAMLILIGQAKSDSELSMT